MSRVIVDRHTLVQILPSFAFLKYFVYSNISILITEFSGEYYRWINTVCDNFIFNHPPPKDGHPEWVPRSMIPAPPIEVDEKRKLIVCICITIGRSKGGGLRM